MQPKREVTVAAIVPGSVRDAQRIVLRPYTIMFDTTDSRQWFIELEDLQTMREWVDAIEQVRCLTGTHS